MKNVSALIKSVKNTEFQGQELMQQYFNMGFCMAAALKIIYQPTMCNSDVRKQGLEYGKTLILLLSKKKFEYLMIYYQSLKQL